MLVCGRAAASRFHGNYDVIFSQGTSSHSVFPIRKELIPSPASLRVRPSWCARRSTSAVLAERFSQKFDARELWRER